MSLVRITFHSAILSGWFALLGWILAELITASAGIGSGAVNILVFSGLTSLGIGASLNLVSGISNSRLHAILKRIGVGAAIGALGGILGGLIGNVVYASLSTPESESAIGRIVGWFLVGISCGVTAGISERSRARLINGLIGGAIGGAIGGIIFVAVLTTPATPANRALCFVILGLSIGTAVGMVNLLTKTAWLSVIDGFGIGRELILSNPQTIMGRGDHLPLPFFGATSSQLALEHAVITKQTDGSFEVAPMKPGSEVKVNGTSVGHSEKLHDGDLIKLGGNLIKFRTAESRDQEKTATPMAPAIKPNHHRAPPPVPRPKTGPSGVANKANHPAPGGKRPEVPRRSAAPGRAPTAPPPPPIRKQPNTTGNRAPGAATRKKGKTPPPPPPPPPKKR